jgi:hypothetical protein
MAPNRQTECTKCLLEKLKGNDNIGDLEITGRLYMRLHLKQTGRDDGNEYLSSMGREFL